MYRIGIGYDIHRLVAKRRLVIGGINVPSRKGLLGHSDADVLLHAVCDALLGAAASGDIGTHFPDSDPAYKGISSTELLKKVQGLLKGRGFRINNVDSVVILEAPKLKSLKGRMRAKIAAILKVDKSQVSVKAKTREGLGDIGRGRAACAYAVALIEKQPARPDCRQAGGRRKGRHGLPF